MATFQRFLETGTPSLIVGSILSALLLALNLYTKDQDLSELASKHRRTANEIWLIREKYLSLIADLVMGGKPLEVLQQERDALAVDLHAVYSTAPSTNSEAYAMAQEALKDNEEMSFLGKGIGCDPAHAIEKKLINQFEL